MSAQVSMWVEPVGVAKKFDCLRTVAKANKTAARAIGLMGVVNCTNFWKTPPSPLCPLFIHFR